MPIRFPDVGTFGETSPADREVIAGYLELAEAATGEELVTEGSDTRDLFVMTRGSAAVTQGGVEITRLVPGDQLGELSLLTGAPRLASVTALEPVEALALRAGRFEQLCNDHPNVALRLVQQLVQSLRTSVSSLDESVRTLLHERSLPRRLQLQVTIDGEVRTVPTGTPLRELVPSELKGRRVVAARLDEQLVALGTPLTSDAHVTCVTDEHWEGQRIFQASVCLLLLEAAARLDEPLHPRVGPSIGIARGVSPFPVGSDRTATAALRDALDRVMRELVEADEPLREELWTAAEARKYFHDQGDRHARDLLATWRERTALLVSYGQSYTLSPGPLVPSTGFLAGGYRLELCGPELILLTSYGDGPERLAGRPSPQNEDTVRSARCALDLLHAQTRDQRQWLQSMGVDSVGALNRAIIDGGVSQILRVSEGFQEKRIATIAEQIADRTPKVRIVTIAGPSSSGKSTFIKRLSVQLQVLGLRPLNLGLDDYYVDRDKTVRDEDGNFDFEALEALQLELLSDHLVRLLAGERVKLAHYNFRSGKSHPTGGAEAVLEDRSLLVIEGIHGLNPKLLALSGHADAFRILVCPMVSLPFDRLTGFHVSDLRLLRRIVRDRHGRGYRADETIEQWPRVRRGERLHIFPYQHEAQAVFDTALIYEPSVLRVFADRYLAEVPIESRASSTAIRLRNLLAHFLPIQPDHVPGNSLLREFIGGSVFE